MSEILDILHGFYEQYLVAQTGGQLMVLLLFCGAMVQVALLFLAASVRR
jgi:hypothetical protein